MTMPSSYAAGRGLSSAHGSICRFHPWVETSRIGSTRQPTTHAPERHIVRGR
jgi:hypothetical protein